mmetsp:Transcript_39999/g.58817  ORF Transcript_39999/g.58817 Transcript_39999/m.58817 type:complete len:353 (-) Transcript_39999:192-1250(-)|eukprot:CAMPEP_0195525068 /NCGR_PEP_ID=MMETSP0794_2-20130614/25266_1 /TAXON_ID=515487 /ORGANISM="Stephanopyxis turris, Strain CCMP 815" /LENGTH=352 /DNA_ID=CAMNT_0040655423 /DNA_START=82 /DNA_END=1140 /DNA_ORIENTATION=-
MNDRLGDILGGDDGEIPSWAAAGSNDSSDMKPISATTAQNSNPFGDDEDNFGGNDKAGGSGSGDIEKGVQQEEEKDPWGDPEPVAQPKYMETFFQDVDNIKEDIEAIRDATKRIGEINEEAVLATTTAKEEDLSHQLKPLVDATNKRAKRTKNLLALIKEDNAKLKKDDEVKQSDMRIRANLCNTLTRKFIAEMKLYQNAQQKYKSDIKKKVKRQVQIVQPDATDEDIDRVMKSEGGREALYQEAILVNRVNDSIKNTYATVAGKYQDVVTLETSVAELRQMFLDFAFLTEQQGELLDQIEFQVKSAGDYIEEANVEVHEAIEYQKKSRKKQCWIIVIVVVIVVVLFIAIFN